MIDFHLSSSWVCEHARSKYFNEQFLSYSKDEQNQLLIQTDSYGRNALMLAAEEHQSTGSMNRLLNLIKEVEPAIQKAILQQTDSHGRNALQISTNNVNGYSFFNNNIYDAYTASSIPIFSDPMWTTKYASFDEFNVRFASLSKEEQKEALTKTDSFGRNALMVAVAYRPCSYNAVENLLNVIKILEPAVQAEVLGQIDINGENALMIDHDAGRVTGSNVNSLLKAIEILEPDVQVDILGQTDKKGMNALDMSTHYNRGNNPYLFSFYASSGLPIFSKPATTSKSARYDKFNVQFAKLSKAEQKKALTKTDDFGRNALMLAAGYHVNFKSGNSLEDGSRLENRRHAVQQLLNAIKTLDPAAQAEILGQTDTEGRNALEVSAFYNGGTDKEFFMAYASSMIPIDDKYKSLGYFLERCSTVEVATEFKESSEVLHTFWEKDITDLLKQLEPKKPDIKVKVSIGNVDSKDRQSKIIEATQKRDNDYKALPIKQLHDDLKEAFDEFLTSARTENDVAMFQHKWTQRISTARSDKILSGRSSVVNILKAAASMIPIIGIYFAYNIGVNAGKNRSLIFQSNEEKAINSMQDRALDAIKKTVSQKENLPSIESGTSTSDTDYKSKLGSSPATEANSNQKPPSYDVAVMLKPLDEAYNANPLPVNERCKLLKKVVDGMSPEQLKPATETLHDYWQRDIEELLAQLKPKEPNVQIAGKTEYEINHLVNAVKKDYNALPAKLLHDDLKKELDKFLKSPRTKSDVAMFHYKWKAKIHDARCDKSLKGSPSVMDVLKNLALAVSLVIPVFCFYAAYQAGKNAGQNRNMLFKSRLEEAVNSLQDRANDASEKPSTANENLTLDTSSKPPAKAFDNPEPSAPSEEDFNNSPPPYKS